MPIFGGFICPLSGPLRQPYADITEMTEHIERRGQPDLMVVLVHQVIQMISPDRLSFTLNLIKRMTETEESGVSFTPNLIK